MSGGRLFHAVRLMAGATVIAASTVLVVAQSQSLGDAATRAAQQRKSTTAPSKVYTNADEASTAPCQQDSSHLVSNPSNHSAEPVATPAIPSSLAGLTREDIVKGATPAVVTIEAGSVSGTGFFVAPGLVLTNKHVISSGASLRIRFFNGRTSPASVSVAAQDADLALVAVANPPSPQPTLTLDSVQSAQVGEEVLAIGSPLGVLQSTVTRGIVSAIRNVGGLVLVQTDAAINPGNSGGPLMDQRGRVIGITTLKFSSAESLGFAIAADHALQLLQEHANVPVAQSGCGTAGADREQSSRDENLERVLNGSQKSATEAAREKGVLQFELTVRTLAREADLVDAWWKRYQAACADKPARHVPDGRDWFGVWTVPVVPPTLEITSNSPAIDKESSPQCRSARSNIVAAAQPIRTEMAQAEERARRAGISPGVVRDIRKKYAMDWSDWDR